MSAFLLKLVGLEICLQTINVTGFNICEEHQGLGRVFQISRCRKYMKSLPLKMHLGNAGGKIIGFSSLGSLYPMSMRINDEGRLVVNFRTEIRFQGQLVMSHPGAYPACPPVLARVSVVLSTWQRRKVPQ